MRIGYGYDFHNLIEARDLILGGVKIPYYKGLDGHSDADVVIHAICDGLLGAMAAGDIGEHFPPEDDAYKGISSVKLLDQVLMLLKEKGFKIVNIDTLLIAEEPKMTPFKAKIKSNLLKIMNISDNQLNIKAKTTEGKGALGRAEAIACECVVLIEEI